MSFLCRKFVLGKLKLLLFDFIHVLTFDTFKVKSTVLLYWWVNWCFKHVSRKIESTLKLIMFFNQMQSTYLNEHFFSLTKTTTSNVRWLQILCRRRFVGPFAILWKTIATQKHFGGKINNNRWVVSFGLE